MNWVVVLPERIICCILRDRLQDGDNFFSALPGYRDLDAVAEYQLGLFPVESYDGVFVHTVGAVASDHVVIQPYKPVFKRFGSKYPFIRQM